MVGGTRRADRHGLTVSTSGTHRFKSLQVKDIFMWKKSFISAAATGGNFFAACVHLYLPLKYFMCFGVTGGFLVESELGRWTGRLSRAKALYTQVS